VNSFEPSRSLPTGLDQITCLANDRSWLVAGCDAWLVIFYEWKRLHTIQVYRDSIAACSICQRFDVIVAGTNDGSLILWTCESALLVRSIELGRFIPRRILVSPSWGFIVSACEQIICGCLKHHIFVHTINGSLVARTEVNGAIDFWYSWTSSDGFDYLFYVTDKNQCNFCEVYDIGMATYVHSGQGPVLAAFVSNDLDSLVFVTASGHAYAVRVTCK
jgi:WD40 repeat protein